MSAQRAGCDSCGTTSNSNTAHTVNNILTVCLAVLPVVLLAFTIGAFFYKKNQYDKMKDLETRRIQAKIRRLVAQEKSTHEEIVANKQTRSEPEERTES